MKKVAVLCIFTVFLFCCVSAYADEVINANPGFERSLKGNWYKVGIINPEVKFALDDTVKHSGKHSARIAITKLTRRVKGFGPPNWALDITSNIPKGKKVKLTAYVKTRSVKGIAPIAIQCWNDEGRFDKEKGFGTTQFKYPMTGTTDWKKVSIEMTVPANTKKIRILCMLSGTGTVWFDDVKLMIEK